MSSRERDVMAVAGESDVSDGSEGRVAPTGRDARLWRVLVELSLAVGESRDDSTATQRPKSFVPGQLERLFVEFDDAYTIFVEGMERLPSDVQLVAIQAVDRQLAAMVRAQEEELWTQKGLREDGRWLELQRLSLGVIEAFAWPSQRLALVVPGAVSEGLGSGRSSGTPTGSRSCS